MIRACAVQRINYLTLEKKLPTHHIIIAMDKVSVWDIDRLKEDIKKYSEMRLTIYHQFAPNIYSPNDSRDSLSANVKKMEKANEHADETLKNIQYEGETNFCTKS